MRATIGITAGDPAGIGLEVVLKSIDPVLRSARWMVYTDREIFERNRARFGSPSGVKWIARPSDVTDEPLLFLRDLQGDTAALHWGKLHPEAGRRALAYLDAASADALAGRIHAIVTAPVNKEAIGGDFHGQTDYLASRAGVEEYAMSFFAPTFKVVLATMHISLRDALAQISTERYIRLIRFVARHLPMQRIAVAAINPHAA